MKFAAEEAEVGVQVQAKGSDPLVPVALAVEQDATHRPAPSLNYQEKVQESKAQCSSLAPMIVPTPLSYHQMMAKSTR